MNRASTRGSGGTKSARPSASVGRATLGRTAAGAGGCAELVPATIALAAPAAPAAAPCKNLRRSTDVVEDLSTRLATGSPIGFATGRWRAMARPSRDDTATKKGRKVDPVWRP